MLYWRLPNNDSLWSFWNAPATKNSSEHLDTSHHVAIVSLKQFFHGLPRRHAPLSDKSRQLSLNGTRSCLIRLTDILVLQTRGQTMNNDPKSLVPFLQPTSEPPALIYQTRHV
ncbi:hypothetical protein TNIN_252681 [Trichonephila inaurata madagascariensis]|uniref:Uncharacterized protein n=1 Tax=Trichonephila inaurata madagascariensis TaxID=2747483 RepID=A0A8X6X1S6_9ARAC|nr:hypothetical protein TNIN_252681 [Trichonephila inaurata madagascariensis]